MNENTQKIKRNTISFFSGHRVVCRKFSFSCTRFMFKLLKLVLQQQTDNDCSDKQKMALHSAVIDAGIFIKFAPAKRWKKKIFFTPTSICVAILCASMQQIERLNAYIKDDGVHDAFLFHITFPISENSCSREGDKRNKPFNILLLRHIVLLQDKFFPSICKYISYT